jgi:hypothetical protein
MAVGRVEQKICDPMVQDALIELSTRRHGANCNDRLIPKESDLFASNKQHCGLRLDADFTAIYRPFSV